MNLPLKLGRCVDGSTLALLRIGMAAVVFWEVCRYAAYGWIGELFVQPALLLPFPLAPVPRLPGPVLYGVFVLLAISAVFVGLGLFYRLAAPVMAAALAYVFLLDASYSLDLNHMYLMLLLCILLACVPAHRAWSLDAYRRAGDGTVPFWCIWLFRLQIVLVFLYAGLAKIGPEWRESRPATRLLEGNLATPMLAPLLRLPHADELMVAGGLVVDLALPLLLLFRRTRVAGILLALVFLTANGSVFHIGVFPLMAVLATLSFLEPDAPRRLLKQRGAFPEPAPLSRGATWFVALYAGVQILLPLRAWLYPQPTSWSEEGHFFAWRMMLLDKHATMSVTVRDPHRDLTADWDPLRDLTPRQLNSVAGRPELILAYAHQVAREVEEHEGFAPEVRVRAVAALGRRTPTLLIDPDRDLAREGFSFLPYDWVLKPSE